MTKGCDVAILAGGFGTRLKDVTGDKPKVLARVDDTPILEHLLRLCEKNDLTKIAVLVHYQAEEIIEFVEGLERLNVEVVFVKERSARGTAGALKDALGVMADTFFVLYGDVFCDVDLKAMLQAKRGHDDGLVLLHPNDHPHDSDLVSLNEEGFIDDIFPYPHADNLFIRNLVNAGLILVNNNLCNSIPAAGKADIAKDIFPQWISENKKLRGYVTPEYIKDMGTPERLSSVCSDLASGRVQRLSSKSKRMAVFLDRDGTINRHVGHLSNIDDLELLPFAGDAIKRLNKAGIMALCITNQPVIARGELALDGLNTIHGKLDYLLGLEGSYLDKLYFCPHHPDAGFDGEKKEMKIKCECRKPNIALISEAIEEFNIDVEASWFVGDTTSDILAGKKAGLKTVLLQTGEAGLDGKYDVEANYVSKNLDAAVDIILKTIRSG